MLSTASAWYSFAFFLHRRKLTLGSAELKCGSSRDIVDKCERAGNDRIRHWLAGRVVFAENVTIGGETNANAPESSSKQLPHEALQVGQQQQLIHIDGRSSSTWCPERKVVATSSRHQRIRMNQWRRRKFDLKG